jgi:hypothetical protein
MTEYVIRFLVGGAVLGDLLRPKSFAGLLGAAPSSFTQLAIAAVRPVKTFRGLPRSPKRNGLSDTRGDER